MRRHEWRDAKPGYRAVPARERAVIHTYQNARGQSVEIVLNEFAWFVVYVDGHVIHSEARSRHQGPHTERTAKARALAYERQDRDEGLRVAPRSAP